MQLVRVIPCLLLRNRGLVKTVRFRDAKYVGDPINAVKIFNDKQADELVFLDIGATAAGTGPDFELIADIAAEAFMPFGYGGGIRTVDDMKRLVDIGVEKVILNTAAVENPRIVAAAAEIIGSQGVVVAMDVKKGLFGGYHVMLASGTRKTELTPQQHARNVAALGAGEIFVNSIDRDGTMQGYDLALVRAIAEAVAVPVVACGGAGTLAHLQEAVGAGATAVAAGSLFTFYGKHRAVLITYPHSELEALFQQSD